MLHWYSLHYHLRYFSILSSYLSLSFFAETKDYCLRTQCGSGGGGSEFSLHCFCPVSPVTLTLSNSSSPPIDATAASNETICSLLRDNYMFDYTVNVHYMPESETGERFFHLLVAGDKLIRFQFNSAQQVQLSPFNLYGDYSLSGQFNFAFSLLPNLERNTGYEHTLCLHQVSQSVQFISDSTILVTDQFTSLGMLSIHLQQFWSDSVSTRICDSNIFSF